MGDAILALSPENQENNDPKDDTPTGMKEQSRKKTPTKYLTVVVVYTSIVSYPRTHTHTKYLPTFPSHPFPM
jgi:hypothetical protein